MIIAIIILHVIVSIGLILVVLLQTGKGAEVGAVFGGSSSTIFGSSGAGKFLDPPDDRHGDRVHGDFVDPGLFYRQETVGNDFRQSYARGGRSACTGPTTAGGATTRRANRQRATSRTRRNRKNQRHLNYNARVAESADALV